MESHSLESKFASLKQFVEFEDVQLQYSHDENLTCRYRFVSCKSQEGDRIAIYQLGWTSVKEYAVFEWVPVNDLCKNTVTFNKYNLPKNTSEMYQMCYISSENQTYGVSAPFQFSVSKSTSLNKSITSDHSMLGSLESQDSDYSSLNVQKEIQDLKIENKLLRRSFHDVMEHLLNMQKILCLQQKEINLLKEERYINEYKKLQNTNANFNILSGLSEVETDFEIGELESIPPFPFTK